MRLPDSVTIVRPTGTDEYGNPSSSFVAVTETPTKGFLVKPTTLLLGPDVDLRRGDRVRVNDRTFAVEEEPLPARSPSRTVLVIATLTPLEA